MTDTLAHAPITETKFDEVGQEIGKTYVGSHYMWTPVVRVACLSLDGTTLTILASDLGSIITWIGFDTDETYTINFKYMKKAAFEALGEFGGF